MITQAQFSTQQAVVHRADNVQRLPFRIRLANSCDLVNIAAIRQAAYGHHVPHMQSYLNNPEEEDYKEDSILVVAESKLDGQVLGSVRIINNLRTPLHIEKFIALPTCFRGKRLAQARRLTVRGGKQGLNVSISLAKAVYHICRHSQMDEILVAARHPVDRMYKLMQFVDVLDGQKIHLPGMADLPHSLLSYSAIGAEDRWRNARWAMYPFMLETRHPDFAIDYEVVHERFSHLSEAASPFHPTGFNWHVPTPLPAYSTRQWS